MSDAYTDFHLNLLKLACNNLQAQPPFSDAEADSTEAEYLAQLHQLIDSFSNRVDLSLGQELLGRLAITYTELMPLVPRDLFWFFGGSCLHFMPDNEIAIYQQLDELRHEAEQEENSSFDYEAARTRLLGLH